MSISSSNSSDKKVSAERRLPLKKMIKLRAEISQTDTSPINMNVGQQNEQLSQLRLHASQYRQQPILELPRLPYEQPQQFQQFQQAQQFQQVRRFQQFQQAQQFQQVRRFQQFQQFQQVQQFQQPQQLQQPKRMARKRDEISPSDAEFITLFNNTIRKELDKTYTNPDYSLYGDDNKSQKRQRK